MSSAFLDTNGNSIGAMGLVHFPASDHVVTDDRPHPVSTVTSRRTLEQNKVDQVRLSYDAVSNNIYLSPSASSPSSDDAWNIVRLWIPFSRIKTINCRIDVVNFHWLRTEAGQGQGSHWNGASRRHISGRWLLCGRLNGRRSSRCFRRTRIFETLLNGYRPVLSETKGRIDNAAVIHPTSDDPLGLSNSAGDGTLRERTKHNKR